MARQRTGVHKGRRLAIWSSNNHLIHPYSKPSTNIPKTVGNTTSAPLSGDLSNNSSSLSSSRKPTVAKTSPRLLSLGVQLKKPQLKKYNHPSFDTLETLDKEHPRRSRFAKFLTPAPQSSVHETSVPEIPKNLNNRKRRRGGVLVLFIAVVVVILIGVSSTPVIHGHPVLVTSPAARRLAASQEATYYKQQTSAVIAKIPGAVGNLAMLQQLDSKLLDLQTKTQHGEIGGYAVHRFTALNEECTAAIHLVEDLEAGARSGGINPSSTPSAMVQLQIAEHATTIAFEGGR